MIISQQVFSAALASFALSSVQRFKFRFEMSHNYIQYYKVI